MGNFMIPVGSTTGNFKLMFQSWSPFWKDTFEYFEAKLGLQWTAVVNLPDGYHAGRFARTKLSVYWVECSNRIKYIHLKVVTLLAKKLKGIENGKLQTWCGWKSQRQMFGTVQYLVKSKSKVPLRLLQHYDMKEKCFKVSESFSWQHVATCRSCQCRTRLLHWPPMKSHSSHFNGSFSCWIACIKFGRWHDVPLEPLIGATVLRDSPWIIGRGHNSAMCTLHEFMMQNQSTSRHFTMSVVEQT